MRILNRNCSKLQHSKERRIHALQREKNDKQDEVKREIKYGRAVIYLASTVKKWLFPTGSVALEGLHLSARSKPNEPLLSL